MHQVVLVLDANNLSHRLSFLELSGTDVAESDRADESLALQVNEYAEWLCDRISERFRLIDPNQSAERPCPRWSK
jgi:hypothetical protein